MTVSLRVDDRGRGNRWVLSISPGDQPRVYGFKVWADTYDRDGAEAKDKADAKLAEFNIKGTWRWAGAAFLLEVAA